MKQLNARAFVDARNELGLSLKEVATLAGVAIGTVSEIEAGEQDNPKLRTFLRLVRVLGKPADFFYAPGVQEFEHRFPAA